MKDIILRTNNLTKKYKQMEIIEVLTGYLSNTDIIWNENRRMIIYGRKNHHS